jgi:ABC-type antimicrobial peptide transport system permease subunit
LPAVAAWSAHGAIAAVIAGIPTAIALSAAGGSNVREQSAPILLAVLAIAYIGGVVYALLVRRLNPRETG